MSYNFDQQDKGSNTVAWFITGAVLGFAGAALLAPKPGREARQSLAESAQKGKEAATEAAGEAKVNIVDAGRDMFERGRKLVDDAAELFDRGRKLMRG